jgi:predicted phage terminase large subunit-like protein
MLQIDLSALGDAEDQARYLSKMTAAGVQGMASDADLNTVLEWSESWKQRAWASKPVNRAGKQVPTKERDWRLLIWKSGRGFGKTEAECQWLGHEMARLPNLIGHAVAPTLNDVRGTLFLGRAGFRAVIPAGLLYKESWEHAYDSTHHEILLKNGSLIRGFGAKDQGGRLRGPQCHAGIGDELREWDRPAGNLEFVHSNMMLGVRLPYQDGTPSRAVFGTTPRPIPYLKNLYKRPDCIVVTGTTYENLANLSPGFLSEVMTLSGTQLGKIEILGEDIDSEDFGIYKKSWLRLWPAGKPFPQFSMVMLTMDTAMEEEARDNKTGKVDFSCCVVLGIFNTKQCFTAGELMKMGVRSKYAALVCDFWMERLGFPELLEKTRDTYRKKYQGRFPNLVLIENKASGISLRQTLQRYGVPSWPFEPHGQSKTMRAHVASPLVKQGMLFLPESGLAHRKGHFRDWCEPLVEQMTTFAGEGSIEFDDAVDAITQAMLYLQATGTFTALPLGRLYPDADELEEQKMREATAIAEREKHGKASPYGS